MSIFINFNGKSNERERGRSEVKGAKKNKENSFIFIDNIIVKFTWPTIIIIMAFYLRNQTTIIREREGEDFGFQHCCTNEASS